MAHNTIFDAVRNGLNLLAPGGLFSDEVIDKFIHFPSPNAAPPLTARRHGPSGLCVCGRGLQSNARKCMRTIAPTSGLPIAELILISPHLTPKINLILSQYLILCLPRAFRFSKFMLACSAVILRDHTLARLPLPPPCISASRFFEYLDPSNHTINFFQLPLLFLFSPPFFRIPPSSPPLLP